MLSPKMPPILQQPRNSSKVIARPATVKRSSRATPLYKTPSSISSPSKEATARIRKRVSPKPMARNIQRRRKTRERSDRFLAFISLSVPLTHLRHNIDRRRGSLFNTLDRITFILHGHDVDIDFHGDGPESFDDFLELFDAGFGEILRSG